MSERLPIAPRAGSAARTKIEADPRVDLKSMPRERLGLWFKEELGEPRYRADQVFSWLHQKRVRSFSDMTNLSKALRGRLDEVARIGGLTLEEVKVAKDGTRKLLLATAAGDLIETVIIPMEDRLTQCISSQVGCKIGCDFCLTARMPLRRHLAASEIVDQVLWAQEVIGEGKSINNLVYMGMGEPLDNYSNVLASLKTLTDEQGLHMGTKRITVSTSGVVPKIAKLGADIKVNLAVSLNATTDAQRTALIPINKVWNIETLMAALRAFPLPPRRRITVEYVMLAGFNDSLEDAVRLTRLLRGLRCKVNLIPFNPWPGSVYKRPAADHVDRFAVVLRDADYTVTVRYSKGEDIGAACGQLDGAPQAA